MSNRTKAVLLGLGPEAVAYALVLVGLSIQWAVLPVLIIGVGLPLVAFQRGLKARRNHRLSEAPVAGFSWRGYLRRERHLSSLSLVFVTALVFWVGGVTFGTMLFACGALILLVDQYVFAPRVLAKVADWESGRAS